jgi:hypothetical protein
MKRLFFVLFLFCNGFSQENNNEDTEQNSFFNESKQKML